MTQVWQQPLWGSASQQALTLGGGGTPPSPAHRYWRIRPVANYNNTHISIAGIEMAEEPAGADITSTGYTIYGTQRTGFEGTKAFDGDDGTAWSMERSASSTNWWVGQDFGTPVEIKEVRMKSRNDDFASHSPAKFLLEYSDNGTSWTTLWTVDRQRPWSEGEERTYTGSEGTVAPTGPFRFWAIHSGDSDVGTNVTICELEMASSAAGADATSSANEVHGAERASFTGAMAFDNNTGSANGWGVLRGTHSRGGWWVGQDFGSAFDLYEFRMTSRPDAFYDHTPRSYAIICSDDGIDWQVVWYEQDLPVWSAAQTRTYVRP